MLLDEHTLATSYIVIADDSKMKLSEDQYNALLQAGKATEAYCREKAAAYDAEVLESLKAKGVTFVEVPDKTPWREACGDVISQFTSGLEDTYQGILDCASK